MKYVKKDEERLDDQSEKKWKDKRKKDEFRQEVHIRQINMEKRKDERQNIGE